MRVVAFDEQEVIERIRRHLGLWDEDALAAIGGALQDVVESAIRHQVASMTIDDTLRKRGSIIRQLKDEMAYVAGLWGSPWRPSKSRACASFRGSFLKIFRRRSAMQCALKVNRALLKAKGASPSKGLLSKRSWRGRSTSLRSAGLI
jgi:hypothetical protein